MTRIVLLIVLMLTSFQGKAWIAYGFKSGMSRFEVTSQLSDKNYLVTTDSAQRTSASPRNNKTEFNLGYCSKPQRLYLLKFNPVDSLEVFVKIREKFEKRYGSPTPLATRSDYRDSEKWGDADISLIWDLNEFETILLTHSSKGTSAEFQDLSVCE